MKCHSLDPSGSTSYAWINTIVHRHLLTTCHEQ